MSVYLWSNIGDILSSFMPPDTAIRVGSSQGSVKEGGNLYITAAPKFTPGSAAANIVVAFFPIMANSFDIAGRALAVTANGGANSVAHVMTGSMVITPTLPVINSAMPTGGTTTTIASMIIA